MKVTLGRCCMRECFSFFKFVAHEVQSQLSGLVLFSSMASVENARESEVSWTSLGYCAPHGGYGVL